MNLSTMTKVNLVKRTAKHLLCCFAVLCLMLQNFCFSAEGGLEKLPVEVTASVDRDKVTIGDKITYTITVKAERNIEVKFPEFAENLGGFVIKNFGSSKKTWFKNITYRQWYVLDTYTSGEYTIPQVIIKYRQRGDSRWQEVAADEVTVEVESVLQNAEDASDIRDIAGPIGFPVRIPWYLWTALILVLSGASAVFFLSKHRKAQEDFIPPKPAHEIAYEALQRLKNKDYLKHGQAKMYYIELSDIVRRYLENRFNLRAPHMSTEEFLNTVKNNKLLSYEQKNLLREFLSHCDLVKFAKYEPPHKEVDLSFESAKKLIDQTRECITPNT